jgi:rubrerythrin
MTSITLAQAIRDAVASERAAARFYQQLHDRTTSLQAQRFLKGMADEEARHAAILEVMAERRDIALPEGESPLVEVVETAPAWKDVEDISIEDALEIAREAETQACLYYDALADGVDGELAAFFRGMSNTEKQHIETVAKMKADWESWQRG